MPEPLGRHFDGVRFFNPSGKQALGFRDLIRWQRTRHPENSPDFVDDVTPAKPQPRVDGGAIGVTLVNHSTVLIQHRGVNVLTDPIWSERASPLPWIGPKRRRAPGIRSKICRPSMSSCSATTITITWISGLCAA